MLRTAFYFETFAELYTGKVHEAIFILQDLLREKYGLPAGFRFVPDSY